MSLRRLTLAFCISVILAGTAFAGETNTPPCANPGETNTPPCPATEYISDDELVATSSTVSGEVETVIFEAASFMVESLLTLY